MYARAYKCILAGAGLSYFISENIICNAPIINASYVVSRLFSIARYCFIE